MTFPTWAVGTAAAVASFAGFGTIAALWPNPLFMRMTPAGGWEVGLLGLLSLLIGLFIAIRPAACPARGATAGGVIGFLGVACPVCNKILLLLVGGEALMTYFEPVRIYVAALGVLIAAWAVRNAWRLR